MPNPANTNQLVSENLAVARRIANKVARRCPAHVNRDDLVAAAYLGLAEAAQRYTPRPSQSFLGFAVRRIRGAVLDELRRRDDCTRRARQRERALTAARKAVECKSGRPATDTEIAEEMDITLTELQSLRTQLQCSQTSYDDGIAVNDQRDPGAEISTHLLASQLRDQLGELDERSREVLKGIYFEDRKLADIGKGLGVTAARVCQLRDSAIRDLRSRMGVAA